MNKKQRWVFVGLLFFPVVLAMSFRAWDNRAFHNEMMKNKKTLLQSETTAKPIQEGQLTPKAHTSLCAKAYSFPRHKDSN